MVEMVCSTCIDPIILLMTSVLFTQVNRDVEWLGALADV